MGDVSEYLVGLITKQVEFGARENFANRRTCVCTDFDCTDRMGHEHGVSFGVHPGEALRLG